MSKIEQEDLQSAIHQIFTSGKKRKFLESIDVQIKLRNFDLKKNKKFGGTVKLPHTIKSTSTVMVLADVKDTDRCKALGCDSMDVAAMKALKKDKKKVKKLAGQYCAFLASKSLIRKIPRLMGPALSRSGKFPAVLDPKDDLEKKLLEARRSVKFQTKKEINLGCAIGDLSSTEAEVCENFVTSINFLVSLCPKKWQNIEKIVVKTTMGKPVRVF